MKSVFTPRELVMMGAAVGLECAGITDTAFNPSAPLCACRLCGAVFQTEWHRELHRKRQANPLIEDWALLRRVLEMNGKWREKHTMRNHTWSEVDQFTRTGWALTPEAANVLAPFGIIPMGNATQEIVDALYEAPRKPDLTLLQGGE